MIQVLMYLYLSLSGTVFAPRHLYLSDLWQYVPKLYVSRFYCECLDPLVMTVTIDYTDNGYMLVLIIILFFKLFVPRASDTRRQKRRLSATICCKLQATTRSDAKGTPAPSCNRLVIRGAPQGCDSLPCGVVRVVNTVQSPV